MEGCALTDRSLCLNFGQNQDLLTSLTLEELPLDYDEESSSAVESFDYAEGTSPNQSPNPFGQFLDAEDAEWRKKMVKEMSNGNNNRPQELPADARKSKLVTSRKTPMTCLALLQKLNTSPNLVNSISDTHTQERPQHFKTPSHMRDRTTHTKWRMRMI